VAVALRFEGLTLIPSDFNAALDAFILSRQVKNLSSTSVNWYRERLGRFAQFCQQRGETPSNFRRETVMAFLYFRLQRATPQTVNGDLRAIKTFARWLIREGFRNDDPTQGIEKLKEPVHYPRTLSDEQIVALVNTIAKHAHTFSGLRDLTFVCLLLDTGLRLNEALNLKLSDIDLSQGFVRVIGKGNKERFVPVGESVKVLLQRYLMRRLQVNNAGDWLFITTVATRWSKRGAQKSVLLWSKRAKIGGVRVSPHSLRFTFVRRWLKSGGDSIVLQRILGHSTPVMTAYYARLFATDLKDAHKRHSPIDALAPTLKLPRQRIR
jgi:integrase/recombinase XerD